MKKILELITEEVSKAFEACGYDKDYGKVSISNRPDLCEYQCNGAMACAKAAGKTPFIIADEVKAVLDGNPMFSMVDSVKPGFLNLNLSAEFLKDYVAQMAEDDHFGCEKAAKVKTIVMDYGGPNVAKPLHVGHLRPAIIGESIKRIQRFMGHTVYGDVHIGDWGLPIGLIITELRSRKPDLVYFDDSYTGEYPAEPPFTLADLEEMYPYASAYSKEHEDYRQMALAATNELQQEKPAYIALLKHILALSVTDLKKNYAKLNVDFDLWLGESDAQPYIPAMIADMKAKGIAVEDDGALVVDIREEGDKKELPPCLIQKSDGASLYATTDLATIVQREKDYHPDEIIYVVDKRQDLHFTQVFRTAKKAGIVGKDTKLTFMGFGTMNGKDGKPFKTRDGGVMRLSNMISEIQEEMYKKIVENHTVEEQEGRKTAEIVGIAALKYGDLSNQASKDYIFDMERFTSFEGNTGPYILYSVVRIKSILAKYEATGKTIADAKLLAPVSESEKSLMNTITGFAAMMETASAENAPHKVCAFIYDLANSFNHFYHETKILAEENADRQASYIALLDLTKRILETCVDLLGFEAPDRM